MTYKILGDKGGKTHILIAEVENKSLAEQAMLAAIGAGYERINIVEINFKPLNDNDEPWL